MRANFQCLNKDLAWQRRYFFAWIALAVFGVFAFALGEDGALAIAAQGLFFIAAFAVTLWPVCAAFQSECDRYVHPRRKPGL